MISRAVSHIWNPANALDGPGVLLMLSVVAGAFLAAPVVAYILNRAGAISPTLLSEILRRTGAWVVIAILVIGPILAGRGATIIMGVAVALLCYREYARATGLFRNRAESGVVAAAILATGFAAFDHWYGLFVAIPSLALVLLATVAVVRDTPKGYIQRVGLAALGVLMFATCLGHAMYLANDQRYRSILLLIIISVSFNDVFAFCVGKSVGGRKLAPLTSPGKTLSGAIGAIVLTTALVWVLGRAAFAGTPLQSHLHLVAMGLLLSCAGILGDLTISSVKRDIGIKDMGVIIPGHGGVLDRCNSMLLAAPALFHYIGYFLGVGLDQPTRVLTGGW